MHVPHLPKPVILAALALLTLVSSAEAIIIYDFPIFGVVNGAQAARINAVLQPPPEGDQPCPVSLAFFDSQGVQLGGPDTFELGAGVAAQANFIGDPGIRVGQRVAIRAQITIGDPNQFPGCAGGVLASVEVIDRLTRHAPDPHEPGHAGGREVGPPPSAAAASATVGGADASL